jgi:hypothetical protein
VRGEKIYQNDMELMDRDNRIGDIHLGQDRLVEGIHLGQGIHLGEGIHLGSIQLGGIHLEVDIQLVGRLVGDILEEDILEDIPVEDIPVEGILVEDSVQ